MDPDVVHLKKIEALIQPLTQAVRSASVSTERMANIERLLERIAIATENIVASNTRLEQMMTQAWVSYDKLARQQLHK